MCAMQHMYSSKKQGPIHIQRGEDYKCQGRAHASCRATQTAQKLTVAANVHFKGGRSWALGVSQTSVLSPSSMALSVVWVWTAGSASRGSGSHNHLKCPLKMGCGAYQEKAAHERIVQYHSHYLHSVEHSKQIIDYLTV